jgi:DNA-binding response OmpR family regulator
VKVLIIEDDKFIAEALVMKFKENGFDIGHLDNGEKVVAEAITQKPNIIILDIILPGKDGFEILQDLKKDDKTKNIPVIIVSNLGTKGDLEKGRQLGAVDFMIKATVTPGDIVEKAKKVLAGITTGNQ